MGEIRRYWPAPISTQSARLWVHRLRSSTQPHAWRPQWCGSGEGYSTGNLQEAGSSHGDNQCISLSTGDWRPVTAYWGLITGEEHANVPVYASRRVYRSAAWGQP